jgi:GNAT superfamily N-acetyltransferase
MTLQNERSFSADQVRALAADHPVRRQFDALQRNMASYLGLFAGLPGTLLHEENGVSWFLNAHAPPGNFILKTRFSESTAMERVQTVLAQVSQHADFLDWPVYCADTPANLEQVLAAAGCAAGRVPWMLADLAALPDLPWLDDFRVEQVSDLKMLETWQQASALGFEIDPQGVQIYYDAYARQLQAASPTAVQHIGFWRDRPVTSSTLLLADGIAGVYDVSTPPQFRQRGFAAAITQAIVREARDHGYQHACLIASEMGASVYARVGFSTRVWFPEYTWRRRSLSEKR